MSPEANVIAELKEAEEIKTPELSELVTMKRLLTGPNPAPDAVKMINGLVAR